MSLFTKIKVRKPKRNVFDLSHEVKLSCNMGQLIPILCQDIVPGDSFQVTTDMLVRLAPMIAPMMHRVNVYTHFFFVPNRIIWDDWETFITKGVNGDSEPVFPYFNVKNGISVDKNTLGDYLGFPTSEQHDYPNDFRFSMLPFRACAQVYNDYYLDQNLMSPIPFSKASGQWDTDGDEFYQLNQVRNRCWEKDYFTSALPWTQRGPEVTLPFSGNAPLIRTSNSSLPVLKSDGTPYQDNKALGTFMGTLVADPSGNGLGGDDNPVTLDLTNRYEANLADAAGTTINELRRSFSLQRWLEKNARGGSRYVEQILSHFGVVSSDARLQRPEYLGGGKSPVIISEVLQTSASTETSPQANMSGHGISAGSTHQFRKFFEEHGWIIGFMSVMPRTAYQQGLPKKYQKFDNMDYYFPEFAHLGEQPILNSELYVSDNQEYNIGTFGYTPRYAEYKYEPSRVAGDFRDTLNFWHMGRVFNNPPELSEEFVVANPTTRVFAVDEVQTDKLWIQLYNNVKAVRPMPKFGTPNW